MMNNRLSCLPAWQESMKRTAEDIIAIGQDLLEVKAALGHGRFLEWLKAEFDMSQVTANNFIQVAKRFGDQDKLSKFDNFPVSVLYELAAPSTPNEIVEQVQAGAQIKKPALLPAWQESRWCRDYASVNRSSSARA